MIELYVKEMLEIGRTAADGSHFCEEIDRPATSQEIVDEVIQRFYEKHGLNYELIVREGAGRGVGRIERQLTPEDLEEEADDE